MPPSLLRLGQTILFVLLCAVGVFADEKIDLHRLAPVPADQPIPVQDFFRPPLFARPKLNATGTWFAASIDLGDHTGLMTCDLSNMKFDFLKGSANKDLYSFTWLDRTKLVTSWTSDRLYAVGLFVTDATRLKDNYAIESYSATELIGVPRREPMKPLVWIRQNAYDEGKDLGVVQIDATKRLGRNRDTQPGSMQAEAAEEETSQYGARASIIDKYPSPGSGDVVVGYMADKDGQLEFGLTANNGVYELFRLVVGKWQKCPVDLDTIDIVGAGDKSNELIVVGPRQNGKPRALQRLDAVSGNLGEVLLQDESYDAEDCQLYRHPVTGTVLGVWFLHSQFVTAWFDPAYRDVQKLLETRFPGQVVQILGSDEKEGRFFVRSYSDRQPVTYYSLDLHAHTVGLIKCAEPWLDPARMLPMRIMKVKTRDGHHLEAFLTLPAGASKDHPAPLVVLPHGGPWARDEWGFDREVQFLASRGYAVLQPNYRGSTGYNWMFPATDQWAFRKMHEDVTDAVKTLLSTGFIDRSRLAIMGTSFGGYLAACGAAFEPDLYRCAIAISGVFDWAQVMKEAKYDQYSSAKFGILRRFLGDPNKRTEDFDAISPLRHVDQMKIPVFVAHGKEDNIADVAESRRLIIELEKFHVPHEVMIVGGEGHGMHYLKNEVALYSRLEDFLAKNLAPAAKVAGTP